MKDISLFILNYDSFFSIILILIIGIIAIITLLLIIKEFKKRTTNAFKIIFLNIHPFNRYLLIISIVGFLSQILLFKNKLFEYYELKFALSVTFTVTFMLSLLFLKREKIDNKTFNDFVIMFLVGQSAYCMIMANQDLCIIFNILYASMYIGIPMFMALEFTSREQNTTNTTKNILEKLKLIEEKLDKSIDTSYKPSKSIFSMFKRSK